MTKCVGRRPGPTHTLLPCRQTPDRPSPIVVCVRHAPWRFHESPEGVIRMKKHGNTHKAPRSKRNAPSTASQDSAQASNADGKINIATADDVGVQDNDRDSGSSSVSDASLSR